MTIFEQKKDDMIIHFEDNRKYKMCDLLVGADEADSIVHHQLLLQVLPSYAGYISWRCLVNESDVSSKVLDIFLNKFTFSSEKNSYFMLSYSWTKWRIICRNDADQLGMLMHLLKTVYYKK